jgi:hypothetical protein
MILLLLVAIYNRTRGGGAVLHRLLALPSPALPCTVRCRLHRLCLVAPHRSADTALCQRHSSSLSHPDREMASYGDKSGHGSISHMKEIVHIKYGSNLSHFIFKIKHLD